MEILLFHRVLPSNLITKPNAYYDRGTLISIETFKDYLIKISNKREIITFNEWRQLDFKEDEKLAILTFDDGFLDNYLYVLPELEKLKIKGVFFPILGCCRNNKKLLLDDYYYAIDTFIKDEKLRNEYIIGSIKKNFLNSNYKERLEIISEITKNKINATQNHDRIYMDLNELRTLENLGHELGGHSIWHEDLTKTELNLTRLFEENIKLLKLVSKKKEFPFAWPDGKFDSNCINKIEKTDFFCAVSVSKKTDLKKRQYSLIRTFCN